MDSLSYDEYSAKVIGVTEKWNDLERVVQPGKEPAFSVYFRDNIKDDLKNGTFLPVRRSSGLEDKFFLNNVQECANFKYK